MRRWWRRLFVGDWSGPLTLATARREWFEVTSIRQREGHGALPGGKRGYLFPRDVLEAWGVDCSPADREPRGTIWFSKEICERMHKHPEYEPI